VIIIIIVFLLYLYFEDSKNTDDINKLPILSELFSTRTKYENLSEWERNLTLLCKGHGEDIEFTHEKFREKKVRRKVLVKGIYKTQDNRIYIGGYCYLRKENRIFGITNITTMIKVKSKRFYIEEYLDIYYDIENF